MTITAPVARSLAVADIGRSLSFYREKLGFSTAGGEATFGPARLVFTTSSNGSRAVVFFETGALDQWRQTLEQRGCQPTPPENVNFIKHRVFSIQDPDGHTLWFAQTYAEPVAPAPPPQLRKALPEMPCRDIPAAVAHYRDALGFHLDYQQHDLAVMYRDEVTVLLVLRDGQAAFEVYVENADTLYGELTQRGARVQAPPVSQPWGLRTFAVLDRDGNTITFAQTFE